MITEIRKRLHRLFGFYRQLFTFYFLLFTFYFCSAQQYNFQTYSVKEGLASSTVNNIFQDSQGYLWFATQDGGVSKFDGKQFTNYTTVQGLASNEILTVCEDAKGNIWFGTNGYGVSMYDGTTFKTYTEKDGLGGNTVYCIYKDKKGMLWFATFGGLSQYRDEGRGTKDEGKKFSTLTTKDGLSSNELFCIKEDTKGNYWIGTSQGGLCKYNGKKFVTYNAKDGLSSKNVFSLLEDKKGNIWLGTTQGAFVYDGKTIKKIADEIKTDWIGNILQDKRGNIWFASDKHGLVKYDGKEYKIFSEKEGLVSNAVQNIMEDYEGKLWVATLNGVSLLRNEAIVNYTAKEGLNNTNISAVYRDSRGNLLVAVNNGGLYVLNIAKFSAVTIKELSQITVLSITEDERGNVWAGTEKDGVFILSYSNQRYSLNKSIKKINEGKLQSVYDIIKDSKNNMWVASYSDNEGIYQWQGNTVKHYTSKEGLDANNIFTIMEDKKGFLWIGTRSGLIKYDGKSFMKFTTKEGLCNDEVYVIAEDKKGRIFLGTNGGLSCYDGKKFTTINEQNGLCSNLIRALVCDKKDNIFIGTIKGVNKIKFSDSLEITSLRYYGETEGIKGIEINQRTMFLDNDGLLWFGTINGLCSYNPELDFQNTVVPKITFTGIKLFYENVDWSKYTKDIDKKTNLPQHLELSYQKNHLTFNFHALTTAHVKYSYLLEGLDNKWSPLTTNDEAVYSNIPPNTEYTFKVKAINNDGIESDIITYAFKIKPPFWKTWWFITLCVLTAMASIYFFIKYREKKLEEEKQELEEKVEERTFQLKEEKEKVELAHNQIAEKNKSITDSIYYARRIQRALLTSDNYFKKHLQDYFILYKPKDIVSGDFYWAIQTVDKDNNQRFLIASADCTGHGVPGAFMSMLGISFLHEIVVEKQQTKPQEILNSLRDNIIKALNPDEEAVEETKDGMDIVLCNFDFQKMEMEFAAANNSLYLLRDNKITEYEPDKFPVGKHYGEKKPFRLQTAKLQKGDCIYAFTDGYADQFGGRAGKKFKYTQIEKLLLSIHQKPMAEQNKILNDTIEEWKGDLEQLDDILVIGIRV